MEREVGKGGEGGEGGVEGCRSCGPAPPAAGIRRVGRRARGRGWRGGRAPVLPCPAPGAGLAAARRRAVRRVPGRWPLCSRSLPPLLSHAGLPDCGLRTLGAEDFLSLERVPAPLPASRPLQRAEPAAGAARRAVRGRSGAGSCGASRRRGGRVSRRARGEHR